MFSEKVKTLRKAKNMTLLQLSEATGLTIPTLSNYEHGKGKPSVSNVGKLAVALECDFDELYNTLDY